jgi:glycerol-3-phosphate dehydrogenase (NAD(P)+)
VDARDTGDGPVAVLGAGAWGTTLARHTALQGRPTRLWSWQADHVERLRRERENAFLPGVALPERIEPLADLEQAVRAARLVVIAVPTAAVRGVLERAASALEAGTLIAIASKGIEDESLMLLTEVVADVLGPAAGQRAVALSGPSFAVEVARGLPTNLVAASHDELAALVVQRMLATPPLRLYTSGDPLGVQVGGALKNVIAIAAGAADGLGFGHNTRAALITRGLSEVGRLARAKGGQALTLAGLAGLGDLVLTCTAELSRNRTVGFELGCGRELAGVLSGLGHVAEGVTTARSAYHLAGKLGVELPILNEVYRVLYEGKPVDEAVRELLTRPLKKETE